MTPHVHTRQNLWITQTLFSTLLLNKAMFLTNLDAFLRSLLKHFTTTEWNGTLRQEQMSDVLESKDRSTQ